MISKIISFFKQSKNVTPSMNTEDSCPTSWGYQEYDNQIRVLDEDKQIDINNHIARYSFIKAFMVKHINGIKLKRGKNSLECPTCVTKFSIG